MIVQLTGNVKYPITLDPTVWIFDDRKLEFANAFDQNLKQEDLVEPLKTADQLNAAIYQQMMRPPVNNTVKKYKKEELLSTSFVMPILEFLGNAEVNHDAKEVILETENGDAQISIEQLMNCYLLFSIDGKPIKEDGPVHLYFKDGSNKNDPITGIKKIIIQ